jgi:hypothetical protein
VVLREGISSFDATKVWNFDSLKGSHSVIIFEMNVVIYLQLTLEGKEALESIYNYAAHGELTELAPPYFLVQHEMILRIGYVNPES